MVKILIEPKVKHNERAQNRSKQSPVTSRYAEISSKNFLTFSFNSFSKLVQIFKTTPSAIPKLMNLNQDHPSKKWFYWSNPNKIEVMITSFIEMLELLNFGHTITIAEIIKIITISIKIIFKDSKKLK